MIRIQGTKSSVVPPFALVYQGPCQRSAVSRACSFLARMAHTFSGRHGRDDLSYLRGLAKPIRGGGALPLLSGTSNAGFSAPSREFPHRRAPGADQTSINQGIDSLEQRRGSCPQVNERPVLRATVLSIIVTLMAGPNASMLCKAWCAPATAAATKCHYQHGSPSSTLTGTEDCGQAVLHSVIVIKEETRRGAPSSDSQAVIVPRHQRAISSSAAHLRRDPGCTWSLAQRPLAIALRI